MGYDPGTVLHSSNYLVFYLLYLRTARMSCVAPQRQLEMLGKR